MSSLLGKRKLPRRELPWIGTLLDRLPFSKLPTNGTVLRRLMFELEQQNGTNSLTDVTLTVKTELVALWDHAGYGDILKTHGNILTQLKALRAAHYDITRVPVARRSKDFFKKKESAFISFLGGLFDITVKSKQATSPDNRCGQRLPTEPLGQSDQLYKGYGCTVLCEKEA